MLTAGRCGAVQIHRAKLNNEAAIDLRAERTLRRTDSVNTSGKASIAGTGFSRGATTTTAAPGMSFSTLVRMIRRKMRTRPVVLLIDETQTAQKNHELTLSILHEVRHGLPIMTLFAGFANSRKVLVQRGISRLGRNSVHAIVRLAPGELGEAVRKMLDRFRIDVAGADVPRWRLCWKMSPTSGRDIRMAACTLLQKVW